MLIVGENLRSLILQEQICEEQCYDNTCISLSLGSEEIRFSSNGKIIDYGEIIPEECTHKEDITVNGLVLSPHESAIASSFETIGIPVGYFGLLQTKGSLARLMVSLHCSDGQVDPGFSGKITFEIINNSEFTVRIRKKQTVGNLYLFKTSTDANDAYSGRYQNAKGPTVFLNE